MSKLQDALREKLAQARDDLEPELIETRLNFHREPELRYEVYRTAEPVEESLSSWRLSVISG